MLTFQPNKDGTTAIIPVQRNSTQINLREAFINSDEIKNNIMKNDYSFKIGNTGISLNFYSKKDINEITLSQKIIDEKIRNINPENLQELLASKSFQRFLIVKNIKISKLENVTIPKDIKLDNPISFARDIIFEKCSFEKAANLGFPMSDTITFKNCTFNEACSICTSKPSTIIYFDNTTLNAYQSNNSVLSRQNALRFYGVAYGVNFENSNGAVVMNKNDFTLNKQLTVNDSKIGGGHISIEYLPKKYVQSVLIESMKKYQNQSNVINKKIEKLKEQYKNEYSTLMKKPKLLRPFFDNLNYRVSKLEYDICVLSDKKSLLDTYVKSTESGKPEEYKEATSIKINSAGNVEVLYEGEVKRVSMIAKHMVSENEIKKERVIDYHNINSTENNFVNNMLNAFGMKQNKNKQNERQQNKKQPNFIKNADSIDSLVYIDTYTNIKEKILNECVKNIEFFKSLYDKLKKDSEGFFEITQDKMGAFIKDINSHKKSQKIKDKTEKQETKSNKVNEEYRLKRYRLAGI